MDIANDTGRPSQRVDLIGERVQANVDTIAIGGSSGDGSSVVIHYVTTARPKAVFDVLSTCTTLPRCETTMKRGSSRATASDYVLDAITGELREVSR